MDNSPKSPNAARLLQDLRNNDALTHEPVPGADLDARLALLRVWQSERLTQTYADLLEDKQYRPACLFFLSDIYAPRDFTQRDHDLYRVHNLLGPLAPPQITQALAEVIDLNQLTNQLDDHLVHVLFDQLGVTDTITPEIYARAYKLCDNYADRLRQIDLITKIVVQVGKWAHLPVVGLSLKLIHGTMIHAGWVELYGFLEHGYGAFKQMRDVSKFVNIVEEREKRILNELFETQV